MAARGPCQTRSPIISDRPADSAPEAPRQTTYRAHEPRRQERYQLGKAGHGRQINTGHPATSKGPAQRRFAVPPFWPMKATTSPKAECSLFQHPQEQQWARVVLRATSPAFHFNQHRRQPGQPRTHPRLVPTRSFALTPKNIARRRYKLAPFGALKWPDRSR